MRARLSPLQCTGEQGWKGTLITEARRRYTDSDPIYKKGSSRVGANNSKSPPSAPRLNEKKRKFLTTELQTEIEDLKTSIEFRTKELERFSTLGKFGEAAEVNEKLAALKRSSALKRFQLSELETKSKKSEQDAVRKRKRAATQEAESSLGMADVVGDERSLEELSSMEGLDVDAICRFRARLGRANSICKDLSPLLKESVVLAGLVVGNNVMEGTIPSYFGTDGLNQYIVDRTAMCQSLGHCDGACACAKQLQLARLVLGRENSEGEPFTIRELYYKVYGHQKKGANIMFR